MVGLDLDIKYPSPDYKDYIECVYEFCKDNKYSMILKGSLAKGTATKFSDVDLIVLGNMNTNKVDELITLYGKPIMTNFTENPKGILILVYQNNISVDLDLRETISQEDLVNSKVILKYDNNFIVNNKNIVRKQIVSEYMPERPEWYKTLRLLHRGAIKYLSNKTESADNLLLEIKDKLIKLEIIDLNFKSNFKDDIQYIFNELCKEFEVDLKIRTLFNDIFQSF